MTPTSIPEVMSQETAHRDAEEARQRVARDIAAIAERVIHPLPKLRQRRPRRILAPHRPALPDSLTMDDPGLTDLPPGDYVSVFKRAGMRLMADNMTSVGKGVAYGAFFAIPSALLVALGILNLTAGPGEVTQLVRKLHGVVPASAQQLIESNLQQVQKSSAGGVMVIVGLVLAVFSLMGAVQTVIWGMNVAYERKEERGFVKQRVAAILITLILTASLVAVFTVLVLAPYMASWVGDMSGYPGAVSWLWWTLQWPILLLVLLAAFGGILYLGPDVDHPRFQFITPGALSAAVLWIVGSALFGLYASKFSSYNKTWGSLAGVIITLTWLWLCSVAILFAAEVNAELERTREIRSGTPPSQTLTVAHD